MDYTCGNITAQSTLFTVKSIQEVKEGKMYVPKYEEVKLRPCPKPPLKCFVI